MPSSNKLSAWKKAKTHEITLPSGTEVTIQVPDLAALIESGDIPNSLLDIAVQAAGGDAELTPELLKQQRSFNDHVILKTVVEPALTPDDLAEIPAEDKAMLVEIATRQRDLDALGNHIGGLQKIEAFRTFRGL